MSQVPVCPEFEKKVLRQDCLGLQTPTTQKL